MKNILLVISFIGFFFNTFAQDDTLFVEEYDTIIVTKDPVVVNSQYIVSREPATKKYEALAYLSAGSVLNNITICETCSKDSLKRARQYEYYFSFNALFKKKNAKRIGIELGVSCDYFKQKYTYPDSNSTGTKDMYGNTLYAGIQSSIKYAITRSKKKFNLAYYLGLKGIYAFYKNGLVYNAENAYKPNNIDDETKNFNYGLISRLEASYQVTYNSYIVFGVNYYFDLKYYTNKNSVYYIHRNIPGLFLGYTFGF